MSKLTRYFQVTGQMLLSYEYDRNSTSASAKNDPNNSLSNHHMCIVKTLDGNTMVIDNPVEDLGFLNNNVLTQRFPDKFGQSFFYPGYFSYVLGGTNNLSFTDQFVYTTLKDLENNRLISDIVQVNDALATEGGGIWFTNGDLVFDKIRLYLISGYVFNNIAGICIKVKAKQDASVKNTEGVLEEKYVTLADFTIFKERLRDSVTWIKSPMYMNSRFYDRYIEISIPSVSNLASEYASIKGVDIEPDNTIGYFISQLKVHQNCDIIIEFALIENDNVTTVSPKNIFRNQYNNFIGTCTFETYTPVEAAVTLDSNSDMFNVKLYYDEDINSIVYYPVWGDNTEFVDFGIEVMNMIEHGTINMLSKSFVDNNSGADEFADTYGTDANKWVVVNELAITYNYQKIDHSDYAELEGISQASTEIMTSTIDYTNKTIADGQFWRTNFKPIIQQKTGMQCVSIMFNYTAHLINRLNGAEVIRSATMKIGNPEMLAESIFVNNPRRVNMSNLNTWRVFNKYESTENVVQTIANGTPIEKYIKSYYDASNIVVSGNGNSDGYQQGGFTLKLFRTDNEYVFNLFTLTSDMIRVPYNLIGPYKHYLVFKSLNDKEILVKPVSKTDANLGSNAIQFKITASQAEQIMAIDSSERFFSIVSQTDNGSERTTLYQGKVDWL